MQNRLNNKNCAELFKALADETRLKIMHSLFEREKCVTDLMEELKLIQSHISHHLKTLKVAGIINSRRDGHKICYFLAPQVKKNFSQTQQEALDLGCCEVKFIDVCTTNNNKFQKTKVNTDYHIGKGKVSKG